MTTFDWTHLMRDDSTLRLGTCHRGSCAGHGVPCEPHPCPYAQEINEDHSTLCNCCEACQRECGDDV